jgi:hypothetical protein
MPGRVLARRTVAATDVAALRAAAKMQPPAAGLEAFRATFAAGFGVEIDA